MGLSLLLAACIVGSSSDGSSGGAGGAGTGGSGGAGGTSASGSGGSGGTTSDGSGGTTKGGAGGTTSSNAGGTASGGTTSVGSGGTIKAASGGTTTSSGGSVGGTTLAGTGGKGSGTGGVSGLGGAGTGGTPSAGGTTATGSGGSTVTPSPSTLITSAQNAYWKTGTWTESTSSATVTVNDATVAQTWEGFGGAFNEKGWSYLSTKALQDQALQLLFGVDGIHFAWGRIPMGASDYAMDRYTLDEVPSGSTDYDMAKFSIARDKEKLIPYIKAAQAVKPDIRFWASPWTPPTWMKTSPFNPNTGKSNSPFDGGVMKSDEATLKAHALYFVKFVQAYAEQGIDVEIVAPQNEPNYEQNYPSCHWDKDTFVKFVGTYLGPALASANLATKVMDGTLSNPSGDADIGASVLKDATAKGFCTAIGVQWGMADANQVSTLKSLAGGMSIWVSETKCGGSPGSTSPAPNDFNYGKDTWGYIRDAIVKNGLTGYNSWNMVLDKGGLGIDDTRKWPQNALLVVDSGAITQTPAYYVFRHFSQFVDPGAKVVATSGGDAVAFKNPDGSLVAVMYNSGSANSNYVVAIGGKKLQFAMPASGWATVKLNP